MTDANPIIQNLLLAEPLREPVLRSIIKACQLPPGSRGLDVGCGIGLQAMRLAEVVGSEGHIIGIDIEPELVAYGKEMVCKAGFSERIMLREGDARNLPFAKNTFDWVWSADCVGYPAGELAAVLKELVRVVKPGGSVIILGWSSQQVLPGYPLLEARLNANCSGYLPFLRGKNPDQYFLRALRWFREEALEEVQAQTFVGDVQAPLETQERAALTSLFEMLWGQPQPGVAPEDWKEYERLCRAGSPDFILDTGDYYAFFNYTMFRGKVRIR